MKAAIHKLAQVMNWSGGALLLATGAILIVQKSSELSPAGIAALAVFYALMVATAFGSAIALRPTSSSRTLAIMSKANWAWIVLWAAAMVLTAVMVFGWGFEPKLLKRLLPSIFVLAPQAINILAMRYARLTFHTEERIECAP